ncbi:hypothetical protein [Alloalcanivorax marinus]|uniref:hypothetical protein n=1 Tax=Alloalcanivorax marinus TaxID=1177169 RepID=UPI001933E6EB|nr:hypothetical protein [Alloalcanivorax marinus]MBL7249482.1 hypothetical protein [Alloalcanivorax marinus]
MQLIDLLEGVTFMRTSFHGDVFLDWLKQAKEKPSLMALISGCLHHHGPGTDAGCGCTAATPLSSYPTPCFMALVRSQVLLAELDLGLPYLEAHAANYLRRPGQDIEQAFIEWRHERLRAGLATLTGWCAALHQTVLTLPCEDFPISRVQERDLAILKRLNDMAA